MRRLPKGMPTIERVWASISEDGAGCWNWTRDMRSNGYGQITIAGRSQNAHRAVYELLVEPVPTGMHLDHLCRNRRCVKPEHMEVVTPRENAVRGYYGQKQFCVQGHPYKGDNLYVSYRKETGYPKRGCKTCRRAAVRKSHHKSKSLQQVLSD